MPNILISYRRADSDAIAGRIRDRIAVRYGEESVFMDIDSIPFGRDFRTHVMEALMNNDIVLAIIGPKWQGAARGTLARIFDETDPVRIEIETALKRGIPVIPVLVGGADIPKPSNLPDTLKDLSYRNAAEVSAGRDFNQHIERLLRSMDHILDKKPGATVTAEAESMQPVTARRIGTQHDPEPLPAKRNESPQGSKVQDIAARPATGAAQSSLATRLLVRVGLRFVNPMLEQRFQEHFCARFYWVAQMAMASGILGWVLFGPVDLWSESGGMNSTRFRFMFAAPMMAIVFGLSFTATARKHWQPFVAAFAFLGVSCMTFGLTLVISETWFLFEQAVMSYLIFLAFVSLAPFTVVYMLGVGLMVVAAYGWFFVMYAAQLPTVRAIFCSLFVVSFYAIGCCAAYARERNFRWEFHKRTEMERPGLKSIQ